MRPYFCQKVFFECVQIGCVPHNVIQEPLLGRQLLQGPNRREVSLPPNDLICCLSQFYVPLFSFSSSFFLCSPRRSSSLVSFMLSLHLQLSSALMFDAVHVVVGAVQELNRSQEIGVKPLSCTSSLIWQHGTSLMNYLRMVRVSMATPFAAIF